MTQNTSKKMRSRAGFSRFELTLLGGVGALCCALFWPALAQNAVPNQEQPQEPLNDTQMAQKCQSNLKQMGLAAMMYCQDYDEKMPLAVVRSPQSGDDEWTSIGWADALQPYLKSVNVLQKGVSVLQCPAEAHPSSINRVKGGKLSDAAQLSGFTDYWFNINLAGISLASFESPSHTIIFGEGDGGAINSNARYTLDSLPPRWVKNPASPVYRHNGGVNANYCFADGHVMALEPDRISNKSPRLLGEGEGTFDEGVNMPGE